MTAVKQRPGLTPRQSKTLRFLTEHVARYGYPPSVREIGLAVGLSSTSSVHHLLHMLELKGYVEKQPDKVRALTVVPDSSPSCPHCGGDLSSTNGGTA